MKKIKFVINTHPEIFKDWNYDLNNKNVNFNTLNISYKEKFWWNCSVHKIPFLQRIYNHIKWPFCHLCKNEKNSHSQQKRQIDKNSISKICPELIEYWDLVKNYPLTTNNVSIGSNRRYWWKCKTCLSFHQARPGDKRKSQYCKYCSPELSKSNNINLKDACPELCKEWDFMLNLFPPEAYSTSSTESVWWFCGNLKHPEFKARIDQRIKTDSKCPKCCHIRAGKRKRAKRELISNIFISHPHLKEIWDFDKNLTNPTSIVSSDANQKYWWKCFKCSKSYLTTPRHVATRGGCNFCGKKIVSEQNSLLTHFPSIVNFWSKKNNSGPQDYFPYSLKEVWFVCLNCTQEHYSKICNKVIAIKNNKNGCPRCSHNKSFVETHWLDYLKIDKEFRNKVIIINKKKIKPDAFDHNTNTVYEFYGDFWHGNPKRFNPNDLNKKVNKTFEELYLKTLDREKLIKSAGYNLVTIWESNWNELSRSLR